MSIKQAQEYRNSMRSWCVRHPVCETTVGMVIPYYSYLMNMLPPGARALMHHILLSDGLTPTELSELTGKSVSSITSQLYRLKKHHLLKKAGKKYNCPDQHLRLAAISHYYSTSTI